MSIRNGILALLTERPMYGYQLRQEFEGRTGGTWPLNIGQVYTTIARLERDALVEEDSRRDDGSVLYRLTEAGRLEADQWWTTPVRRGAPARDELAIKLALAVTAPGVDVTAVVQRQRTESLRALQEYTRLKRDVDDDQELSWQLVLESLVFAAEAEVRWLDHVEQRLAIAATREQRDRGRVGAPDDDPEAAPPQLRPDLAGLGEGR
jgi:DNA-binding PadR family transcriptional regulator